MAPSTITDNAIDQGRYEIAAVRGEISAIAGTLINARTMTKDERQALARRLNSANVRLNTARMWLEGEIR